ncbi:hypothetical protein CLV92_102275 [Kineococcus xinjiangensis]|uniref:Fatty acid desaturase n=1 Tax=Kineococcus xinjiangensis TaxID=512762 RepID=A0A2S6IV17_9ACTN|nr:hypothetical protein [Kineococcus xinjiangensis]PPK98122.1 hypothetical protein CLV92_102275 [Kineococcus xinjiangensis]
MAFAIEQYARTVEPVRWDDLDFDTFRSSPLSEGALRCLRYMSDVETHTVCYLRDLLVTPSHEDPEITTFLTNWNYEEYWHGEVLDDVLDAHGLDTSAERTSAMRKRLGWKDRLAPTQQALLANMLGADFIATHMTWGAINEWCTHAAYARFSQREQHPVLDTILKRIAKQETRHIAFYNSQARERLAASRKARVLTRLAVKTSWGLVGSSVMPREEVVHLLTYLFSGEEGLAAARKIDAKVHGLPGLEDTHLVERELRRYGVQ